jgi:hypothetical protein
MTLSSIGDSRATFLQEFRGGHIFEANGGAFVDNVQTSRQYYICIAHRGIFSPQQHSGNLLQVLYLSVVGRSKITL